MLKKYPKDEAFKWSKVFKGVIYVEAVILLGSFYLYRKLCRDQNFRYNCHQKHSLILETFYNFMEVVGHDYYRTMDYKKWNIAITDKKDQ
ncbi:unnamed protein product [Oppiella nova]|uniref:Uncharacterized protein n=1 Tax=Oppiella nova TaxID=334625 RepID=A0A7R9M1D6_9ACAR|nr:unnamed protein product [Oppiella nova]CAG2168743.1 unnamed protein product [Oppiella nova]